MTTTLENVKRVLTHYGLDGSVHWDGAEVGPDTVHAWPADDRLLHFVVFNRWTSDPVFAEEHFHGAGSVSFREPGAHPSLHVIFHKVTAGDVFRPTLDILYWVEMHCDFWNPRPGPGMIGHSVEVIENALTRRVTDQDKMAKALDKRFQVVT